MKPVVPLLALLLLSSGPGIVAAGGLYSYGGAWGLAGSGPGQLSSPHDITFDDAGYAWVVDANDRVQKFTPSGEFTGVSIGGGPSGITDPRGVAADGGEVFVVDTGNNRTVVYSDSGACIHQWGGFGVDTPGRFFRPQGIAVDAGWDMVHIADSGNDRVQTFNRTGEFLGWIGEGHGIDELDEPGDVAVDAAHFTYITDTGNHRIVVLFPDGSGVDREWRVYASDNGAPASPSGIALGGSGHVFVTDRRNCQVQMFTWNGTFLARWGSNGTGAGQFREPGGVALDVNGTVYVADTANNRIQWFRPVIPALPGGMGPPTDTDGDGLYDDVNGNTVRDFNDVILFFYQLEWLIRNAETPLFDYTANGQIDFADAIWLFNHL